jgi:hypothetical protein
VQTGFSFINQYVGQGRWPAKSEFKSFGMSQLVRQASQPGHPGIGLNSSARFDIRSQINLAIYLIEVSLGRVLGSSRDYEFFRLAFT